MNDVRKILIKNNAHEFLEFNNETIINFPYSIPSYDNEVSKFGKSISFSLFICPKCGIIFVDFNNDLY